MDPQTLISTISPLFATAGPAWYFVPETLESGKSIGLDGLRFYFLGRGGTLGDVEWPVVMSAFGYFKPALVEKLWTTAKQRCTVDTGVAAHLRSCQEFGRRHLSGVTGLAGFCDAAELVMAQAMVDPAGLSLFAGHANQPLASDPPARAMQLVATLRELRGSAHLTAVVAAGLPTPVAHRMRRPADLGLFGWGEDDVRPATDDDRRRLVVADTTTDQILRPAYASLDQRSAAALLAGAQTISTALLRS